METCAKAIEKNCNNVERKWINCPFSGSGVAVCFYYLFGIRVGGE